MRDAALVLAALSGLAGLFGVLRWLRSETSPSFWIAVRVGQAAAIAYAVLTGVAYLSDWSPSNKLFYLYALLPVAIGFVAEQLRVISADQVLSARDLEDAAAVGRLPPSEQQGVVTAILRREMGVMAAAAIVVCFLALRAYGTF
ncbi:MAG TPA: hypothetical protein VHM72_06640 [Solirubrobacteraceae bacterium]|jgi:hypothetical protein|nr:hypothetical protein [Solirubrobacteraceae bacterium]